MAEAPRLRVVDRTTPWAVVDSRVAATGTQAVVHCTRVAVSQSPTAAEQHFPDSAVVPSQVVVVLPEQAYKARVVADV